MEVVALFALQHYMMVFGVVFISAVTANTVAETLSDFIFDYFLS